MLALPRSSTTIPCFPALATTAARATTSIDVVALCWLVLSTNRPTVSTPAHHSSCTNAPGKRPSLPLRVFDPTHHPLGDCMCGEITKGCQEERSVDVCCTNLELNDDHIIHSKIHFLLIHSIVLVQHLFVKKPWKYEQIHAVERETAHLGLDCTARGHRSLLRRSYRN